MSTVVNRPPVVAGRFYTNSNVELSRWINESKIMPEPAKKHYPLVMVPHAAQMYSGKIAVQTFQKVDFGRTIIILAPNHKGEGHPLGIWADGTWQTPLRETRIDTNTAQDLIKATVGYVADTESHMQEHSIEVLLPLLQHFAPKSQIVPISVSGQSIDNLKLAGDALGEYLVKQQQMNKPCSLILSTDMNHFATEDATREIDERALKAFAALDPYAFHDYILNNQISMCGVFAGTIALFALSHLRNAGFAEGVPSGLIYATSADVNGDKEKVVGYAGLVVR